MKKYIAPEINLVTFATEEAIAATVNAGSNHFNDVELAW